MTDATTTRILYACLESIERGDGPALHVAAVASRLAGLGRRVTLLQVGGGKIDGVETIDIGEPGPGLLKGSRLRARLAGAVDHELRNRDVCVVYLRGSVPGVLAAARRHNVPLIVEYNAVLAEELQVARVARWRRALMLHREATVARECTAAVAVDEATQDGMERLYPALAGKSVTILNGCDVESFAPFVERADRDARRMAFVGGFHVWTRLDIALEAFALLPAEWHFDIVGDGPKRGEYESLAKRLGVDRRARFFGRVPHARIPEILTRAAIGVCADNDGFSGSAPLKLGEYLAAGCAAAINRYACHEALEALGHACLFANPPAPQGVAAAIHDLAAGGTLTPQGARARHAYAAEHLSWARTARDILRLIERIGAGESIAGDNGSALDRPATSNAPAPLTGAAAEERLS